MNCSFVKIVCWQKICSTFWLTKLVKITDAFACDYSRGGMLATVFCLFGLEQGGLGDWAVLDIFSGWCTSSSLRCLISSQARDLL